MAGVLDTVVQLCSDVSGSPGVWGGGYTLQDNLADFGSESPPLDQSQQRPDYLAVLKIICSMKRQCEVC